MARFRLLARAYGLTDVSLQGKHIRFAPLELPDSKQLRLKRLYPEAVYKAAVATVSLPRPSTRRVGGEPLRDTALLDWCAELLRTVLGEPPETNPAATPGGAPAKAATPGGPGAPAKAGAPG